MELTSTQKALLIAFNEARIPKKEAAALLTLLNEQEIEQILDKIIEMDRLPLEQELMEIMFPILKAK